MKLSSIHKSLGEKLYEIAFKKYSAKNMNLQELKDAAKTLVEKVRPKQDMFIKK